MRISCLVTVCAALLSMLHFVEAAVHPARRAESKDHSESRTENTTSTTSDTKSFTYHPEALPATGSSSFFRNIQTNLSNLSSIRKPRKLDHKWSISPRQYTSKRPKPGRRRRQLQRLGKKPLRVGRSFDVKENQVETIQTPEAFEEGTIHIEPLYRLTQKKNVLDTILDLLRRVIDPPKDLGPLVGPLHFPGIGDKVFIRLIEPLDSNHLVIRLVTRMPLSEIESSFNQNGLHPSGIVEGIDIASLENHHLREAVLSSDTMSSSSNHQQIHRQTSTKGVPFSPASHVQSASKLNSPHFLGSSRTYRVKTNHSDPRGIISQSFDRPHQRPSVEPPLSGGPQSNKRQQLNSLSSEEQRFAGAKSKENSRNQENSMVYVYQTDLRKKPAWSSLVNESRVNEKVKIEDTEPEGSLNPVFITDTSNLREVTRTGRVVIDDISPSKPHFEINRGLRLVDAPSFPRIGTSNRYFSTGGYSSVSSTKPMKYLRTNDTIDSSGNKTRKSTVVDNDEGKVPISASRYIEAAKRRESRTDETKKYNVDGELHDRSSNIVDEKSKIFGKSSNDSQLLQSNNVTNVTPRYVAYVTSQNSTKAAPEYKNFESASRNVTYVTPIIVAANSTNRFSRNVANFTRGTNENVTVEKQDVYDEYTEESVFDDYYQDEVSNASESTRSVTQVTPRITTQLPMQITRKAAPQIASPLPAQSTTEIASKVTTRLPVEITSKLAGKSTTRATVSKNIRMAPLKSTMTSLAKGPTLPSLLLKRRIELMKKNSTKSSTEVGTN